MQYKQIDGVIVCIRCENGEMQFLPRFESVPLDDRIPWEQTDKEYVRLPDFSAFVEKESPQCLEARKSEKLASLDKSFDERIVGTIDAHDYRMQFDISDSLKMQGAIQLLEATGATEGYLTLANDETVYHVPLEVMKAVLVDMLASYAACHARKQELRAAIKAAETVDDLEKVVITWPI